MDPMSIPSQLHQIYQNLQRQKKEEERAARYEEKHRTKLGILVFKLNANICLYNIGCET